jgi:hypothetical protein
LAIPHNSNESNGRQLVRPFRSGTNSQELIVIPLIETPILTLPSQVCYARPALRAHLKPRDETRLEKALSDYFSARPEKQKEWKFSSGLEKLLRDNEPAVRQAAWNAYRRAPIHDSAQQDFATNQVRFENHLSPYTVKQVGARPANGWALFIAMHGGGGVRKEVNDRQWNQMQIYYRDHPEAGGYIYLALRAPNDTWNGFYDVYVYPLVANLVRQFLLFGDVDPNKVFIMGYSHGGYGAYAIGPKMPDRFAAIAAGMAAIATAMPTPRSEFCAMVASRWLGRTAGKSDKQYRRHDTQRSPPLSRTSHAETQCLIVQMLRSAITNVEQPPR